MVALFALWTIASFVIIPVLIIKWKNAETRAAVAESKLKNPTVLHG